MGKTRLAIEAFDRPDLRVLVVAPAMVIAGGTWADELRKWANHPESFEVVPYTKLNARETTASGGNRPIKKIRPEYDRTYDAVVLDEAHYIKGRATNWTWAVQRLAARSEYLLAMTGTPIPNWSHEMFTLLQSIYPARSKPGGAYGSYWRWVESWFRVKPSPFSETARVIGDLVYCSPVCGERPASDPCDHHRDFMDSNFGGQFLRRLRRDCLDLPPVTTQRIDVPMDAKQKKTYRDLKKQYLAEVDGQEVVAWSDGAKNVLLDKVTTSLDLLAETPKGKPAGGKLERLAYDLQGRAAPTVVFAHYRASVEACVKVAEGVGASAAGIHGGVSKARAAEYVRRFKRGELDVLVGSLETLAEGQQLTAADMLVMVETSFKPSRNEQARMRVDRMGQSRPVTILEYVTPDSVDERKRQLVGRKTDHQMRMLSSRDFAQLL